jgi:UDP-N-acetylglucosamine 2-epimerase (non-hydrolysing)
VSAKFFLERPFAARLDGGGLPPRQRRRPLIAHVEAGLRSHDDDMPEEINRRLTDAISDLLFISDPDGIDNLAREGVPASRCFFVGNVMIDTLLAARERAMQSVILQQHDLRARDYVLITLHRPSNVDDVEVLGKLLCAVERATHSLPLVFPVHPRTRAQLSAMLDVLDRHRWKIIEPLGYLDFLKLTASARVVLTDSGGVQEETTVLGVPCVTLRDNTERPVTISEGTNLLAGTQPSAVQATVQRALSSSMTSARIPRLWDGKSAERIARVLADVFPE